MNIVHQIILFINGTSMGCTGVQQYIVAQKSEGQCKDSEDIWRIFKMADDEGENVKKLLEVVPTCGSEGDETCLTFVLHEEDHTLGNSLRYIIAKNPDISFCGYTIPHPSEHKINMRIQTNGILAVDALRKGLSDLSDICEHVQEKFEAAINNFKEQEMAMDDED